MPNGQTALINNKNSGALSLKVIGELNLIETVCADLSLVGMGLITKLKTENLQSKTALEVHDP